MPNLEALWGTLLALLPVVTVAGIILFLTSQFFPSWILLTRGLPRHGRKNPSWQALLTLLGLMVRGLQVRSLHEAARLRIEIELLKRAPDRPLRLNFDGKEEYHEAKKQWRTDTGAWSDDVYTLLAALMRQEEKDRTIEIDTCSPLLGDDDIARYFDALSPRQDPFFLSKVTIRSGFVAPLHLLTGVLAHYEENWQPVVEGYGGAVIRPHDPFRYHQARKMQAFIFDCWLLWGPSTPICTCPEWHGEVALQYGYGDEDNSLTLRCSSPDVFRTLRGQPGAESEGFALRARVTGTLKWGPALDDAGFCPAQIAIWQDDRLVLDTSEEAYGIRPAGGTEKQVSSKYYSAYLWIALVMCTADTKPLNPEHKWRDLIPFFIHGNIADDEAYEFHANQLARGAVEAAVLLLHSEPDLTLCFACAIDETACGYNMLYSMPSDELIREKMTRFAKDAEVTHKHGAALKRLNLDFGREKPFQDGDYSACALPEIVNSYYLDIKEETPDEETPRFHELRFTRAADMDLLKTFYNDCFVPEFPDENERESLEHIQNYLRLKETGWYQKNNYHVIVVLDGDKPIGGSIADYLDKPNAGVIEYFVVLPEHRRTGLGRRLLEATERILHDDADKSRSRPLDWIVAEIDDPFRTQRPTHGIDCFAVARVWDSLQYQFLDFPYVQPALSEDKKPVETLLLTAKICSGRFTDQRVPSTDVKELLWEYMRWAMRIREPQKNDEYNKMCEFLPDTGHVKLMSFSDYLGWGAATAHVHIKEVVNASDPELNQAIKVYEQVFKHGDTAIASDDFRNAFATGGLAYQRDYRYHLWTIRSEAGDREAGDCEGMASFLTMPSAGFGGYLGLLDSLRGRGMLCGLIARIEERMVRDGTPDSAPDPSLDGKGLRGLQHRLVTRVKELTVRDSTPDSMRDSKFDDKRAHGLPHRLVAYVKRIVHGGTPESKSDGKRARGWYIECDGETQRNTFLAVGFREVDIEYMQPPLPVRDEIEPLIRPLRLMYKPFGRVYENSPTIETKAFLQAIREIYTSVYGIHEPDKNERFIKLQQCVQSSPAVKTKPLAGES
jgi:GNAT superfamily N-acetyltransferase